VRGAPTYRTLSRQIPRIYATARSTIPSQFASLEIPYTRRQKFRELTPTVQTTMNGMNGRQTVLPRRSIYTVEQSQFCIDFVIDATLAVERHERQFQA
jgi:hypothetical protein